MITQEEKQMICTRLAEYCEMMGSQNKAANSLQGVSGATITQMLTENWELISEKMWRSVAAQIGVKYTKWNIVETRNYKALTSIFQDAQENALVLAVCGEAGTGKTLTGKAYSETHKNVYLLGCSEYWNRKIFLQELLRVMGKNPAGDTVGDMVLDVVNELKRKDSPLIILDEADKLSDQVLFFFITFYNKLEDYCGIVMMATDYLEKKIRRGLRLNKKGYKEIYSRIGRKFIPMPGVSVTDIADVCRANGVQEQRMIDAVKTDCEGDLRRVKRKCHALNKKKEQAQ